MTSLERLGLQVSARFTGDDLVLVLDYVEALKREVRIEALEEVLSVVIRAGGGRRTFAEGALREIISKERANG